MKIASYLLILFILGTSIGCVSMCDSSLDCQYNAYGGVHDRIDRVNGRVGSIFDAATAAEAPTIPEELLPPEPSTLSDDSDALDADSSDQDPDDESGLADDLLEELRKLEDLPDVPKENGATDAGADSSSPGRQET